MNRTLIIYDNNGKIFNQITGDFIEPVGLQNLIIEIPEGKRIVGVDVSDEEHFVIFEDIPKDTMDLLNDLKLKLEYQEEMSLELETALYDIAEVLASMNGGNE